MIIPTIIPTTTPIVIRSTAVDCHYMNIVIYSNLYKPGVVLVLWEVCGVELVGGWRIESFAKAKKEEK